MDHTRLDPLFAARLVAMLAELFETEVSARMVAAQAGLDQGHINFGGDANARWFSIVKEAQKQQSVDTLVEVARQRFPVHPGLRAAATELAQAGFTTAPPVGAKSGEQSPSATVTVDVLDDSEVLMLATILVNEAADLALTGQPKTVVASGTGRRLMIQVNPSAVRGDQLVRALYSDVELVRAYSERIAFLEKQTVGLVAHAYDFGGEARKVEAKRSETYRSLRRSLRTFCNHMTREDR